MSATVTHTDRQPARWNLISFLAPCVGLVVAYVAGTAGGSALWGGHRVDGVYPAFTIWAGFGAFGLLAGALSLARAERLLGLTVLGFLLSALAVGAWVAVTALG